MASVFRLCGLFLIAVSLGGCLKDHAPGGSQIGDLAPRFSSASSVIVVEGATSGFYTAIATSRNGGPVTYSVGGGADGSLFSIDPSSGSLSFNNVPDFEAPADGDGDNQYEVELRAEDNAGRTTPFTLTIDVTNINEAPQFTSNTFDTVAENTNTRYQAEATDPEFDNLTFSISGGPDQSLFNIDAVRGYLRFNNPPDYDAPLDSDADNTYVVELSAVDGQGGDTRMTVSIRVSDVSRLQLEVSFPTPNANLGGVADTMVTGNLIDLEDDVVEFDDIAFIEVNGQTVPPSPNDPARWSAQRAADVPDARLISRSQSADGNADSISISVRNEALILRPDLIAMEPGTDSLLVADYGGLGALISIDLDTDANTTIADISTGVGPDIPGPEGVVLDRASDRMLVVDSILNAVLSLDLASGDRALISAASKGTGPAFRYPLSLALDGPNNRVLVVDADLGALVSVDLATGNRSIVSDSSVGSGPTLLYPTAVVLDVLSNRALVADVDRESILAVDLANGNRSIVANAGTGAFLEFPNAMSLDIDARNLLVVDTNLQALISIDLASGVGTVVSDGATGAGPQFRFPFWLALDEVRNRALVVDIDLNEILSVDLSSGDRATISRDGAGSGPKLLDTTAVAHHAPSNRLVATASNTNGPGLMWIDLNSGNRESLTDATTGSGPNLVSPTGMAIDVLNGVALVLDETADALMSVDLLTGDRSIVSDSVVGSGPVLAGPSALVLDSANDRALVADADLDALLALNLANGDRSIIADASRGSGPLLTSPTSVSLDEGGNRALVTDTDLGALVTVDLASGDRAIVANQFDEPLSVTFDADGNRALVADGFLPSTLYWVDLSNGDRTAITDIATGGPVLLDVSSVTLDVNNNRAFAVDRQIEGLVVIELESGQRAIASR